MLQGSVHFILIKQLILHFLHLVFHGSVLLQFDSNFHLLAILSKLLILDFLLCSTSFGVRYME